MAGAQHYNWRVRITVAGIDFTSPGCDTKREAKVLKARAESRDDVTKAEVESIE